MGVTSHADATHASRTARGGGSPERAPAAVRPFGWLFWFAVVCVGASVVRDLVFTPEDALQGPAQKILYIHASSAFVALYLAFALMAICSVLFLWLHDPKLDRVAACAAEVGLAFFTVVLVTGPLWARPVWGTWWSGDARLTAALFEWLIILAYLVLRQAVDDPELRGRYSAVLAILAGLLVPFIHLTVYLFRTLHPKPIFLKPSAPSAPADMTITFVAGFCAFAVLFVAFLQARYRLAVAADQATADADAGQAPVTVSAAPMAQRGRP